MGDYFFKKATIVTPFPAIGQKLLNANVGDEFTIEDETRKTVYKVLAIHRNTVKSR